MRSSNHGRKVFCTVGPVVLGCLVGNAANLLVNPSFESDFQGWDDWGNSFIDTTTVHSGTKSARIGPNAGGRAQRLYNLTSGTEYTMCAWSRTDNPTVAARMGVDIYDVSVNLIGQHQWDVTWSDWQQRSVTFTYPASGDFINVWLWTDNASEPTYADNFSLVIGAVCNGGGNTTPVAGLTSSVDGLTADFTDTSTDSDGSIVSWSWDFGDGSSSITQNPSHSYAVAGSYTVSLTVTDNDGALDTTTDTVTVPVSGGGGLEVMTWVPPYSIPQCQAAVQADFGEFDAVDGLTRVGLQFWIPRTNGTIKYADHEWYTPTDSDVAWWTEWGAANNVEILLTVYNNTGSWDWNLARSAFANNRSTFVSSLIAEMDRLNLDGIDLDLEGIGGLDADRAAFSQFVNDLSVEIDARGKVLTIDSFHYIWNAPNHSWWSDWVGKVDNVHSMGYDDLYEGGTTWHKYSYQQDAGYAAGLTGDVVLMGFPSWVSSWGTSSGRGTSALAHVQELRYDLAEPTGIAIWDLQLAAAGWQDSNLWAEIAALKGTGGGNTTPVAGLTSSVDGLTADFTDTSTDSDGSIVSWSWDFGDGSSSITQNPSHSYAVAGSYTVSLTVTDNDGALDTTTDTVTVPVSGGGGLEVMTWVPPYSIPQCQAAVQADFGEFDAVDGLTRVGLQFWIPRTNGTIKYADHEWYTPTDSDVAWWTEWGAANNVEILLTVYNNTGSWDWNLARSAFANNRSTFVSSLIAEMDRLNLDGIDLDLEGIGGLDADRAAFSQFVNDLSVEIDARGKVLTIDSFHYIWNAPNHSWWSDWVGKVDNVHSMGYDDLYEGGTTWHKYSYQQDAGYAAGLTGDVVLMGFPSWVSSWGTSSGRGTSALAHVQELRYDLAEPTGIAIWDLQLAAAGWQDSNLWAEIAALKGTGGGNTTPVAGLTSSVDGLTADFADTSTDSDGSIVSWSWDFGDGSSSTTQNPSHSYAVAGSYTVSLTVTDNDGGSDTATLEVTVLNVNDAPLFTTDPVIASNAAEGAAYSDSIAGSATDADGDALSYSKVSGPAWLTIAANAALSGTPANSDVGLNSFTIEVDDGNGGSDTATLEITVLNVNDAPLFTTDPVIASNAAEGAAYSDSIAGSATDADGDALSYSKVGGPTWLTIAANAALSGTPANSDVGLNSFTIEVDDGNGGSDTATLEITVLNVNDAPLFTTDPVIASNAAEGAAYSDSIAGSATDADGDALSYSKVSGPAWLTIAANAALSGTPANSDVGLNSFTIEVDDGNGGSDTATLTIDVETGQIYNVGPAQTYATIGAVPLETLNPGDTVRIHYQAAPYAEKFAIGRSGTSASPITIQGVANGNGDLPVITGVNATTRLALSYTNEDRSVIKIGTANVPNQTGGPQYIVIENLVVEGAAAGNSFTDDSGAGDTYRDSAAAIYIEASSNVTIRNCELRNSNYGLFTSPVNTYDLTVTQCYLHNNGLSGSAERHNGYTQARGVIYDGNRFGALTAGALGHNIKDRSSGTVIRYNWIEGGGRQIDLVDSEDAATYNSGEYAAAHVYGNILIEVGDEGNSQVCMFGGDSGQTARYRTGTLHFYNNTVISHRSTTTYFFRLNGGTADCRNNIYYNTAAGNQLRAFFGAGSVDLRNNWIKNGWSTGTGGGTDLGGNITSGTDPGFTDFANQNFSLVTGTCVAQATSQHANALALSSQYVLHQRTAARSINNSGLDLGAFEASQDSLPTANIGGPYSGNEGADIALDGSASSDPEGAIAAYAWDFDNNGSYDDATAATPSFSSTVDGVHPIGLRVTDIFGNTATAITNVTVNNVAPTAGAGGPYSGYSNTNIAISASGSSDPGNDIVSYGWNLDNNGSFETPGENAIFNNGTAGVYTIGLRVTDDDGGADSSSTTVTVSDPVPVADIGGPYTVELEDTVTLSAVGSSHPIGAAITITWDLDDDGVYDDATGTTTTFTRDYAGTFPIGIHVEDGSGFSGTSATTVTVNYDVTWTNIVTAIPNGNSLTRGPGNGWAAGASSRRALSEDGYLGVTATTGGKRMVGLSAIDTNQHFNTIDYCLYMNIGSLELYESGAQRGSFGPTDAGADLRITISRGDIIYSRDGVELRRVIGAVPLEGFSFIADTAIDTPGATISNVRLVIPEPEQPEIIEYNAGGIGNQNTFYSDGDTQTIIFHQKTDMGGYAVDQALTQSQVLDLFSFSTPPGTTFTGKWTSAATFLIDIVSSGAEPIIGMDTVQVAGTTVISHEKAPLIANPALATLGAAWGSIYIEWTQDVNLLIDGNKITRPSSVVGEWNTGAISSRSIARNCYFQTTVSMLGANRMIGLGKSNDSASYTDIDYAFFLHVSGGLEAYESGEQTGNFGPVGIGAVLRMEIDGSTLRYLVDGTVRRTVTLPANAFPMEVDTSLNGTNASFNNTILVLEDPAAPAITRFTAAGDNSDSVYSVGDTQTIIFDSPTNQPNGVATDFFTFSTVPGTTYDGEWVDSYTYRVTITTTGTEPTVGVATVAATGATPIYYENTRVQAGTGTATLGGNYGHVRNEIRVAYANALIYDLGQSYSISEVRLTNSGASAAIEIQTSTDGSTYTTANSATLGTETAYFDIGASGRYLRVTGITSLADVRIYTESALPATTWDHVDLRATITNGTITASFQAGKPYSVVGLLTEDPSNLTAPAGNPVVVQTATASSVSTTYFYSDGSSDIITWDFDGADLRGTTNTTTALPGIDLSGRTLVTVDSDGVGVTSGTRSNHRPIALVEGTTDGWVIDGRGAGSFSVASPLTTAVSELRIREYSSSDWQSAVAPHRSALNLTAFSSPVRAYSTATNAALTPALTLLGPLTNAVDIAAAAGYVVVADLASITAADAIVAGASVLYVANSADVAATQAANPGVPVMSTQLTSGAEFALLGDMGHALGGYLFKEAAVSAPTGNMYAPTAIADIDAFMAWGCFLPAYGVDSWNEIVAVAQSNNIAPGDIVWETTATTRSMLYSATNYGTRHFGISTYAGAGALADWKFYIGSTHIGLDPANTYYFNPGLSLDPAAFHVQAIPADFALTSQGGDVYTNLVLSGNGNFSLVIPAGDSVFIDATAASAGINVIAGTVTIRAVTDSNALIHGIVTADTLIGRFPSAAGINLQGSGSGTVHVNGLEIYNSSGAFNVDLSAYSNTNVLVEFAGTWTTRNFVLTAATPVADIGGPYTITEGAGVALSAANSFNAVSYLWDTDNDGNYDNGTGSSIAFSTSVDGNYPIGLRIENGVQFDTASTTVEVTNVAPTANIGGPYLSAPGVTATLDASGSSDPGSDITSIQWDTDGDGNFDNGTGTTLAYTPIASGSHTMYVRVTDDDGASSSDSTTFFASNDAEFTAIINLNVTGNDLVRPSGSGWTASAISVGSLEEDGYLEFTATLAGKAMVGLSENDTASHFSGIKYAFYKNINRVELYEYGVQKGSYGTFTTGDKFRITIDKSDVIYSINGDEIRRVIANEPLEGFSFNADVAMEASGSAVQGVLLAIPAPETPRITDYEGFDPDNLDTVYGAGDTVSISFHQKTDMGGYAQDQQLTKAQVNELFSFTPAPGDDYTGYWSHPAIFVVDIVAPAGTAPAFGSATVQVAGTQPIYNSKVPLLATNDTGLLAGHWGSIVVLWVETNKVIVDGNRILRPSSEGEGWNADGRSSRSFTGDGYMETIVTATGQNRMIGFSSNNSDAHFSSLDFAIFLHASGTAEAYESGVQRGNLGRYAPGDTIRLERSGSDIIYSVKGFPRRITPVSATLALQVDCSLYARNASFNNTILVLPDSIITASRATPSEPIRDAISIHLDAGWNLIGIPLVLDDLTPDFLDGATAEAGHAYWVFAPRPTTHILTGLQTPQPPIPADGLFAPVRVSPVPAGTTAFSFSDGAWRELPGNAELQPGTGYLLKVE